MTRYSASRGIRYTPPPGPDGSRRDDEKEASDARDAAVEADGGETNGVSRPSSEATASDDGGPAADDGGLAADN